MATKLALFDFDGTITTKDSLAEFICFAVGKPRYYLGLVLKSPMLIAYTLKLIPNHIAKEKLISHFFKGWHADTFKQIAQKYSLEMIDSIVREKALEKILWHQQQGHTVVVVSASMELWLQAWCEQKKLTLLGTQIEIVDERLTGRFASNNCYGEEKARRVREAYDMASYDFVYAYGDSSGDTQLLALADEAHYKPFR